MLWLYHLVDAFETLLNQSTENSQQGRVLIGKRRKLEKWTDGFKTDSKNRIEALLTDISSDLKGEIASFAEENYENSNASSEWNKILKNRKVEERAHELLKQFGKKCEEEIKEIIREIKAEVNFSHSDFSDRTVNMRKIVNGKAVWSWATTLFGGGLSLLGLFNLWNPIGWVLAAVLPLVRVIGSIFFGDRESKVLDARRKLEKKLSAHIDRTVDGLRKNMHNVLDGEFLKKQMYPTIRTINDIISSQFTLSKTQREFAVELNKKLKEVNFDVVKEALMHLEYAGLEWHISSVSRIPGYAVMLVLEYGKVFPKDEAKNLKKLLKEEIWYIIKNENVKSMLLQSIWRKTDRAAVDVQKINIEYIDNEPCIAHIPFRDSFDAKTNNRTRMAQQITELLIMK